MPLDTPTAPSVAAPQSMLGRLRRFAQRKLAKRRQRHLPPEQVFADIYRCNAWKSGESISGLGSELSQTQQLIETLPAWFKKLDVRRVIDVPCGDFHWMSRVDLSQVDYLGCDIVDELIQANRRYERENVRFRKLDLLTDPLPPADLILCRDCLVHFSFAHIEQALENIARSGARYLLTTTFTERADNQDIPTGRWRPLNLSAAPFSLAEPAATLVEHCTQDDGQYADKTLALWPIEALRQRTRLHSDAA